MKLLFMGTPEFAAVSLRSLVEANFEICGVVTQPDRPKGRGLQLQPSEVKLVALQHNLPLWQTEKINQPEFMETYRSLQPDLVVVVAFGQKIPNEILFSPKYGCVNVHGSLLPQYRGAAPIHWSLLNGDTLTGITTMYMDEGWDTGDMIYQASLIIDPNENFASLYSRLAQLGGELLVQTVNDISQETAPRITQDHQRATIAPKIKPDQTQIHWLSSARNIHNLVRTLAPATGAETFLSQERLKIVETQCIDLDGIDTFTQPGEILRIIKNQGILVATGDKPLLIVKIQPIGKKVMSALDYANGRRLTPGMFFGKID